MSASSQKGPGQAPPFGRNEVGAVRQSCPGSSGGSSASGLLGGGSGPGDKDGGRSKGGAAKTKEKHWIEIELVDEEGQPVPGEEYCITDPGGVERRGFLDAQGLAREDGIENPGMCRITFPNLDQDAWSPA